MRMAWMRCRLPRREPVDHPVAGGRFDGCGAAVGGEAIAGGEAADRGDATDDGGRDDRADAVDHSHARRGYNDVRPASGQGNSGDMGDPVSTLRGRLRVEDPQSRAVAAAQLPRATRLHGQ
jgi:hypothetical protein